MEIIESGNNRVRKVDLHGIVTTVAGGGTIIGDALATSVRLNSPPSISLTSSGEMLVIDYNGNVVRKMDASGFMKAIAGGGSKSPSSTNPIPAKTAAIKPKVVAYARDGSDVILIGDLGGYVFMLSNRAKCYGVWSDNSTVCSGHGTCMGPDECKCENGWTGRDCSVAYCYDIKFNDKSVCSGHGSCIKTDECECDDGWMGLDCSITHCFGVTSNLSDRVCSGKCVRHNKCHCVDGFGGNKCQRRVQE